MINEVKIFFRLIKPGNNTYDELLKLSFQGPTYRPIQKRAVSQVHPMDPKRELAESLPLCLGNDDYLKDFQPLSSEFYCY